MSGGPEAAGIAADAALDLRRRWRGIAAAIGCISVVGFALSLSIPLLSLILEARGVSDAWIVLNTAVAGLAALVTAPCVTWAVRRIGTVRLLYLALGAGCVSFLLFPATPFWAWFPLRFVFAASITVLFVVSEFWINSVAPDGRRGFVMGIYATVLSAGFASGPAVLAAFGSESLVPFAAAGLAFALAAVPVALGGAIAPKVATRPSQRLLAFVLVAPSAVLAALVFGAGESTMFAFMALFGMRSGLEETNAALLITMAGLGNMLFQIPIGLLADRVNRTMVLTLCGTIGCAGAALLPFVIGTPAAAFAVMFVWGGLAAGLYTVGLTQLGARFSGADLAAANALFVMLYSFGMLIGPAAAGAAMEIHVNGLPVVLAGLFGLYALIAGSRWLAGH